jgi:hypothetical protein
MNSVEIKKWKCWKRKGGPCAGRIIAVETSDKCGRKYNAQGAKEMKNIEILFRLNVDVSSLTGTPVHWHRGRYRRNSLYLQICRCSVRTSTAIPIIVTEDFRGLL